MKKGDLYIAGVLIIAVLLSYAGVELYKAFQGSGERIAVIRQEGQEIMRINLDRIEESRNIPVTGKYNEIIQVEKGRIRFFEANCPDQVCVKTGWISRPGETAVCLPNMTSIGIEGAGREVDDITF